MEYVGLMALEFNVPLIELETMDGEILDLYNESELKAVVIDERGLAFQFAPIAEFTSHKYSSMIVRFQEVRNLCVDQPSDWMPEESSQIEHLLVRPEGPWPRVVFKAGGMEYEFDCRAIHLELECET